MSKDLRVTIRIPENLKQQVQEVANDLNLSFNDAIKVALRSGVNTLK